MRAIICTTLAEAQTLDLKIQAWMVANVPGYNAVRWSEIEKHQVRNEWRVPIKDRCRESLTLPEKAREVELPADWKTEEEKHPFGVRAQAAQAERPAGVR